MTHSLYIDTYLMVGQGTDDRLAAMAQVEVYLRMSFNERLAMLTINENRFLVDAIFLTQSLAK